MMAQNQRFRGFFGGVYGLSDVMHRLVIATACLAILSTSALFAQAARAWEAALDYGGLTQYMVTDSSQFFTSDNTLSGSSLRLGVTVADNVFAEVGWTEGEVERIRGVIGNGGYRATLSDNAWTASGRYRWPALTWLEPYARGGLGITRHAATVGDYTTDVYTATKWAPHLAAGAGVDFVFSRERLWNDRKGEKPRFTFGVTMEFGWRHTFGADLSMQRVDELDPPLKADALGLGTLNMSAFYTRFAVCLRI